MNNKSQQGDGCCSDLEFGTNAGRPFLVEERVVTAGHRRAPARADWSAEISPDTRGLDAAQRCALAEAWLRDGLLEHASIASFGRFAFELLAAGAPAALIEAAHQAALDEVRHAQLCFGLAGAYAGEPVEPSTFPFAAQMDVSVDLAVLAARTVREGCIGETIAAIHAAEQRDRATDAAVRGVLAILAEDEERHAALAWSTVAWAIRVGGAPVRAAVARVFAEASPSPTAPESEPVDAGDAVMLAHGRLDGALARSITRKGLAEVVAPCARSLLGLAC